MSPGSATPKQVLTAVQVELALLVKRLIGVPFSTTCGLTTEASSGT